MLLRSPLPRPLRAPADCRPIIWLCLAATWLVWGSTYLAIKYALISFPPFLQMGSRFLFAGLLLAAWMRWRGAPGRTGCSGATRWWSAR